MKKRFPSWNPKVGERALIPGGPACAQYVDALNEQDVNAIQAGHRGYTPLRVRITDNKIPVANTDLLWYDENRQVWLSSGGGFAKTLKSALQLASQYFGKKVSIDCA